VGEIGIPRREFLYDIEFWEVHRIIRGYRRRDGLKYQLLRLCAYASFSAFHKMDKLPHEWIPLPFDEEETPSRLISEEEQNELTALMADLNKKSED